MSPCLAHVRSIVFEASGKSSTSASPEPCSPAEGRGLQELCGAALSADDYVTLIQEGTPPFGQPDARGRDARGDRESRDSAKLHRSFALVAASREPSSLSEGGNFVFGCV